MKKVLLLLSTLSYMLVYAETLPSKVINANSLAQENGGAKLAIDAYSDGGGVLLLNSVGTTPTNNAAMNSLVFKFGTDAKINNVSLIEQVQISQTKTQKDIDDASILDANNPIVNVADIKSAYLSPSALLKKSAKLPNGTIITFSGTYWKNAANVIQRYTDVVPATTTTTTRASNFGITNFKATGTGSCPSGSIITYYNRHTCISSNTPYNLTCPNGSLVQTGLVAYPSGIIGGYFNCRSSTSEKYCTTQDGYLNISPTSTYDGTVYNSATDLCEKTSEGCSAGYVYNNTNHTCTAQLPL